MDQLSAKAAAPASLHRRHTVPRAETNNTFNPSSVVEKKRPLSIMASSHGIAAVYIVSGCLQPILLTVCKDSGLGDPLAQVYMFFYSLGPALVVIPLITTNKQLWPSWSTIFRAMGIAVFDVLATCTNYYGASLAGPTIFAIVYSSVTVWTAVYSHFVLKRIMNRSQWLAVLTVFGGLALTATDSLELGHSVMMGLVIVIFGSAMHALTYIASEIIMNIGSDSLTASQNCAVQAGIGALVFLCWQLIYTIPNFQEALAIPMQQAGTSVVLALFILSSFGLANLVHSLAFYSTLLNFPGGATSAGVMKGLQAVLVFIVTHVAFCGKTGGEEMCFSRTKLMSLLTVCSGVFWYGRATQKSKVERLERTNPGYGHVHNSGALVVESDLSSFEP